MSQKILRAFCGVAALALVAACGGGEEAPAASAPAADATAPAAAPAGPSGSVAGKVTYVDGDADTPIKMDADPVCQSLHQSEVHTETVVKGAAGELANAFVYVKDGLPAGSYPTATEAVRLEQQGCVYKPHVTGVRVGQPVKIVNNDPTLHNVHALPKANTEFNQGQPFQGMELDKTFDQAEMAIPIKCDVHPWMLSYLHVMDHPFFAVSKEDGSFEIPDLPPGTYTIEAWHEQLGTQQQSVTVPESATAQANFEFKPAA
jgi:plastocyanin